MSLLVRVDCSTLIMYNVDSFHTFSSHFFIRDDPCPDAFTSEPWLIV